MRRGHCPSAGSPLVSGDGLLSRVQLVGGRLSSQQLRLIAGLAERYCSPQLELTQRGNLQLRGFTAAAEAAFTQYLTAEGLAAAPAAAEAARKLLCSAAADLDSSAVSDPWPLAQQVDMTLRNTPALWALPSKFRIVLNGGGFTSLSQHYGDIRADAVATTAGVGYRLSIGGSAERALPLGLSTARQLPANLLALMQGFIALSKPNGLSAQQIAKHPGSHALAALRRDLQLSELAPPPAACDTNPPHRALLGAQRNWYGCAPALGVLDCSTANALADLADRFSDGQLRLCPGKQILLPGASAAVAPAVEQLGLINRADDPRLSITSCPGAPACRSGSSDTRGDAQRWAAALPKLFNGDLQVHVSGCAKGCAYPRASPLTLRANAGRYDVIVNDRADSDDASALFAGQISPHRVSDTLRQLSERLHSLQRGDESLNTTLARVNGKLLRADEP